MRDDPEFSGVKIAREKEGLDFNGDLAFRRT